MHSSIQTKVKQCLKYTQRPTNAFVGLWIYFLIVVVIIIIIIIYMPPVDPFWFHTSRSLFNGLSWFLCFLYSFFLVFSVICYSAFCLHFATSFYCIPIFYTKLWLCSVLLQSLCLLYNLSKNTLLFFSYTYFISAAVILLVYLALMVQCWLPCNRAARSSVL